jgi:hypothetical protein
MRERNINRGEKKENERKKEKRKKMREGDELRRK